MTIENGTAGSVRPRRRLARVLYRLIALCTVVVAAGVGYRHFEQLTAVVPVDTGSTRTPVPVSVATAVTKDVPIYLSGLGTVQASINVDIRTQVDGKLQEVLFTEGQRVRKGDVLARIEPQLYEAALAQARAKKSQDAALLIAARKDLARFQSLALKDFATAQSVDQQSAKVDQLIATIEADDAAIAAAQTQLNYTAIVAPSDGRVGVRLVDPGNVVRAVDTRPIANLVLTRPAAVVFTIPARFLDDVRAAIAHGPVEAVAFDRDNLRWLSTGIVLLIDNSIDPSTSTMRIKAMFENGDEQLWPGEFVNVRLLARTVTKAVTLPSSAVQRGPRGLFTWIITPGNTAAVRAIEIGPSTGDLTIVTSGLQEGEQVIIDGQFKLRANVPVKIAQSVSEHTR